MYHGTTAKLSVGDVIVPSSQVGGKTGAGFTPGDEKAYASPQFGVAYTMGRDARDYGNGGKDYGNEKKPIRVYSVQPVDHTDVKETDVKLDHVNVNLTSPKVGQAEYGSELVSNKGFRIVSEVNNPKKVQEQTRLAAYEKASSTKAKKVSPAEGRQG